MTNHPESPKESTPIPQRRGGREEEEEGSCEVAMEPTRAPGVDDASNAGRDQRRRPGDRPGRSPGRRDTGAMTIASGRPTEAPLRSTG